MERAKRHLSTQDVAEKLGVKRQYINRYELDYKTILSKKARLFKPLCELYGLNPDEVGKMIDRQKEKERLAENARS